MTALLIANAYALGWLASWLVLLRNFARSRTTESRTTDARNAVLLATVWPVMWPALALVVAGRRVMAWLEPEAASDRSHEDNDGAEPEREGES